jgi:hypothetical protein
LQRSAHSDCHQSLVCSQTVNPIWQSFLSDFRISWHPSLARSISCRRHNGTTIDDPNHIVTPKYLKEVIKWQKAWVQVILIACITALATWSVVRGLESGIKLLSNINIG